MEQRKEGILPAASAKEPKLRRKLQKCVTKQQANIKTRFRSSSASISAPILKTREITDKSPQAPRQAPPRRPPTPPKDSRRPVFSQREGRHYDPGQPQSAPLLKPQAYTVPELSHLIPTHPQRQPSSGSDSAKPPTPKMNLMKRRAKTPILSIGQLENARRPGRPLVRTSSVDLIAEQYQARLEYLDASYEPPLSPYDTELDEPVPPLRRRRSSNYCQEESPIEHSPRMAEIANPSPASDDGTLVSFQGDTVYFKPVSLSPEPESSPQRWNRQSTQSTADDNVSLQVCLDLLTRELSSAIAGRPSRPPVDTAALQILVMIEAYEKLRDQMAEISHGNEQARTMESMFDFWLRALYAVHDSMTGGGKGGDYDYEAALGTEELD